VEPRPAPVAPAPAPVTTAPPPASAFQAVSQHQDSEASRPVRRRHREDSAPAASEPLQLVETASDKVAAVAPAVEEEAPRRTKPRRRRAVEVANEPLQLVETRPGETAPPEA
jgi:hypothetical protein